MTLAGTYENSGYCQAREPTASEFRAQAVTSVLRLSTNTQTIHNDEPQMCPRVGRGYYCPLPIAPSMTEYAWPRRFRALIVGRAGAGKTSILKKLCNDSDTPIVRDRDGNIVSVHSTISFAFPE